MKFNDLTTVIVDTLNFNGTIQTSVTNGYADYSGYLHNNGDGNLTVAEYLQLPGHEHLKVMPIEDFLALEDQWMKTEFTDKPAEVIDAEKFNEMLEALPPLHVGSHAGIAIFLMSEFTHGPITDMYGSYRGQYRRKAVHVRDKSTWLKPHHFEDST